MTRIYTDQALTTGEVITIDGIAAHHLINVLRKSSGEPVTLFNGRGGEYPGKVRDSDRRSVQIEIGTCIEPGTESSLDITLVQGISRAERMDYTIQKAVELGVRRIVPLTTDRSVVKLDARRAAQRLQHWQAIIISACEQSGRTTVPVLDEVTSLNRWLEHDDPSRCRLMLQPSASQALSSMPAPTGGVTLYIGPEGGFGPVEQQALQSAGCTAVALGPRILRTETAALVAMSVLQSRFGDFTPAA
ncbi:MAG: 16S rRNA (uracil(1498)-N(3))-methyltransferase [Gammaproteobacteria bacterium]|nr:16S rRNA (uracil(1498)-N(3))-methyltransferase [Gammaproteobacteria bacterium]